MTQVETKADLISCQLEYQGKPDNVRCVLEKNEEGEVALKIYSIPTLEEFQQLAGKYVKRFIAVPNFYAQLKRIIETSVKLNVFARYTLLDIKERQKEIYAGVLKQIQQKSIHIVMPDEMAKKDRIKLRRLKTCWDNDSTAFVQYDVGEEKVVFRADEKANDFLAFFLNRPSILKTEQPSGQKMKNLLASNPAVFSDFLDIISHVSEYYSTEQPPYTQKKWEHFLLQNGIKESVSRYQENVLSPSILELVDQTRRFLCEAILCEHGTDIAETKQAAARILRENKHQIYELAEKYGYIEQAKSFQNCEEWRNQIAHPAKSETEIIPHVLFVSKLYEQFVFRYIDEQFLRQYYKNFPVSFPMTELGLQYDEYQIVREADFISSAISDVMPAELSSKNNKKKLSFLLTKGLITPKESEEITQLFLQRNNVAHGEASINGFHKPLLDILAIRQGLIYRQRS